MYHREVLTKIFVDLYEGLSVRAIHRKQHVARQTVQKYKDIYDKAVETYGNEDEALVKLLNTDFSYKKCEKKKKALIKSTTDRIDELLAENARLSSTPKMLKLVMKKSDIYRILCSEGHKVSYSSVCFYIRKLKQNSVDRLAMPCQQPKLPNDLNIITSNETC